MPLSIHITDYGVGNLYSIRRSLENCVRTTVGIEEHNELLLEKAEEVISGCR